MFFLNYFPGCNCFNHAIECVYDPEVDANKTSLDIFGNYEGGGVCQNCQHNTEGINCNKCKPTYFRPYGKEWDDYDVCQRKYYPFSSRSFPRNHRIFISACSCDYFYSTGNCAEGTGNCECRPEFTPPDCLSCNFGYFGYPDCRPCECNLNGTAGYYCEAKGGQCPCKSNYDGVYCDKCAERYYNFPECLGEYLY